MEERVAIIGIFITDSSAAAKVNDLLHEYSDCIIGRMGVPCREKSMNIISIIVSAEPGRISALSGVWAALRAFLPKPCRHRLSRAPHPDRMYGTGPYIFYHSQQKENTIMKNFYPYWQP